MGDHSPFRIFYVPASIRVFYQQYVLDFPIFGHTSPAQPSFDQPGTFIEGIEAKMLDEVDTIYLYHIHLCPKFYLLYLFTSYNRADVAL